MHIEFIDASTGESNFTPSEQLPPERRAVYLSQGVAVDRQEEADEIVPIVKVVMLPQDENGELVSKEKAQRIIIREYGEGERIVRETLMLH